MSQNNCAAHNADSHHAPRRELSFPCGADTIRADLEVPAHEPAEQLLVLVNGFQRPRTDFRAFRRRLHARLPTLATLAIDNRGSGDSSLTHPDALSIPLMARDVADVALQIQSGLGLPQYSLLGISMGGMIATAAAARNPAAAHLVLVSTSGGVGLGYVPSPLPGPEPDPDETQVVARMERYFGRRYFTSHEVFIRAFARSVASAAQRPGGLEAARAQRRAVNDFDATTLLPEVACPTLVLTGTDDRIIPPENSRELARRLPLAQLVEYEHAGHLLLIEEPQRFADDVAHFLAPVL